MWNIFFKLLTTYLKKHGTTASIFNITQNGKILQVMRNSGRFSALLIKYIKWPKEINKKHTTQSILIKSRSFTECQCQSSASSWIDHIIKGTTENIGGEIFNE